MPLALWFATCGHVEPPVLPVACAELGRARLVATGDILMNGPVKASAAKVASPSDHGGFDQVWSGVVSRVEGADLAFANLEFPVEPAAGGFTREMVFQAPPVVLDSLAAAGFDVVSFANNHVYDQGRKGFVETLEHLDRVRIVAAGAGASCDEAEEPRWFDVDGLSIAVMATTIQFNDYLNQGRDEHCSAFFDDEQRTADQVREARSRGADLVVLSIHWGIEYETQPSKRQRETALRLVDAGVDVLLGHHPHVLQPIERVRASDGRRAVIAYSLGNFVSNQSASYRAGRDPDPEGNPRDGVLLEITAVKRRYLTADGPVVRVELAGVEPTLLWTDNHPESEPAISVGIAEEQAAKIARLGRTEEAEALGRRLEAVKAALGP